MCLDVLLHLLPHSAQRRVPCGCTAEREGLLHVFEAGWVALWLALAVVAVVGGVCVVVGSAGRLVVVGRLVGVGVGVVGLDLRGRLERVAIVGIVVEVDAPARWVLDRVLLLFYVPPRPWSR